MTFAELIGGLCDYGRNDIVTAGDSSDFDSQQWTIEGRAEKRLDTASANADLTVPLN